MSDTTATPLKRSPALRTLVNSKNPADTYACPRCRGTMRLSGIEPHPLPERNSEIVTYECQCGQLLIETVDKD